MKGPDIAALVSRAPDLERPGCYVLQIRLSRGREIRVGRLGTFFFRAGEYVYVGSARAGLARRLARYFRAGHGLRWHIDYLLRFAKIEGIWYAVGKGRRECEVSRLVQGGTEGGPRGFGSSDCSCASHLYKVKGQAEGLRRRLEAASGWRYLGGKEWEAGEAPLSTRKGRLKENDPLRPGESPQ